MIRLGDLAVYIGGYTIHDSIAIMLNGKVVMLTNKDRIYLDITGSLEYVLVESYKEDNTSKMFEINLDVESFKYQFGL